MGLEEKDVTGSEHSKPTTPTSDSGAGNVAESQADTIDPEKSSFDDVLDSQADAATLDSVEMIEDMEAAEKEPLASTSGTGKNKHKTYTGMVSNSASADDLISEDHIITKTRFDEDDSERLNTCTEDFESQASDNGSGKKTWDIRCVVIGILLLLIIVAGAVAAVIAHRYKGPPLLYDFKFASFYGDGMVLQRAPHKAIIWGYGPILGDNTTVRVTLSSADYEREYVTHVKSRVQGQLWKVALDEVTETGPFKITATLEMETPQEIHIDDVVFGDVYLCAGQFENDFKLRSLYNTSDVAELKHLRLFGLNPHKSNFARYDVRHIQVPWTSADNLNVGYQTDNFNQLCFEYGKTLHLKLGYPIGLVSMAHSESVIEEWAPHHVLRKCNKKIRDSSSTVWHGMVNPLMNMVFYGAVWYQGELDAQELKSQFNCTFLGFINEWRNHTFRHTHGSTDRHFPIGIIQLPPNRSAEHTAYKSFTDIRWSQTASYGMVPNDKLKKAFIAATIDLPEMDPDRPKESDVNTIIVQRLMLGTMGVAYRQRNVTYQGPIPTQYRVTPSNIVLYMNNRTGNLKRKSDAGFEICCAQNEAAICLSSFTKATYAPDREWVPAPIDSIDKTSVTISRKNCLNQHSVGIRYAWRETPCKWEKCGVYDASSDLPMLPYIKQPLVGDGTIKNLPLEQINIF